MRPHRSMPASSASSRTALARRRWGGWALAAPNPWPSSRGWQGLTVAFRVGCVLADARHGRLSW